jgi:hypothetical protein
MPGHCLTHIYKNESASAPVSYHAACGLTSSAADKTLQTEKVQGLALLEVGCQRGFRISFSLD